MNKPKRAKPATPSVWPRHLSIVMLLAFAVYANSLSNGFVGDDKEQLLQNPLVIGHQIGALFGSGVWAFRGIQGNYYRPLPFLIYMLAHAIVGFSPFAFHLLMLLLHCGNTGLVYLLTLRLTNRARVALAAAALFAVHPIHTETVDWIASLPDMLVTGIILTAMWTYARAKGPAVIHGLFYLLALLTKETGVMLLPLYVAFDWLVGKRRNLAVYGVMAAALAIYLAARFAALGGLAPGQQTFFHLTAAEFFLSAVVNAGEYLAKLIVPWGLNYFHIFHATREVNLEFVAALAAILTAAAIALRLRRKAPEIAFGLAWMGLTLAPALNLTGVGQNVFAERYLYLPSAGFVWIAAIVWNEWMSRQARAAMAAGVMVLAAFAWQTAARNPDWRDDYKLLTVTIGQSPDAGILHNNLAGVYVERNDLDRALAEERQAVRLEPRSAPFHKNLGLLLMARDPAAAVPEFEAAMRLQPNDTSLQGLLEEAQRIVVKPSK